jgi:hypothetical protein
VAGSFGACCAVCTNRTDCVAFTYWPIFGPGKPDCTLFTTLANNQLFPNAAAQSYASARPPPAAPCYARRLVHGSSRARYHQLLLTTPSCLPARRHVPHPLPSASKPATAAARAATALSTTPASARARCATTQCAQALYPCLSSAAAGAFPTTALPPARCAVACHVGGGRQPAALPATLLLHPQQRLARRSPTSTGATGQRRRCSSPPRPSGCAARSATSGPTARASPTGPASPTTAACLPPTGAACLASVARARIRVSERRRH